TIAPNSSTNSKVKFSSTQSSSILVSGSLQLNIASSNFYTAIQVSNLNNLQSTVENYISQSANQFTTTEFSAQLNSDAFKKVIADAISTTQESIGSISYSGTTLTIAPNSSTNSKVKFSSTQSSSILVSGQLKLNSNNLKTHLESPEDWFTWNDTQITGLSTDGQTQKRIVLPSKTTSISNNAFYNNKTLISVDMSLTSITQIPNGNSSTGISTFSFCSNIFFISLPPTLIRIGNYTFYNCNSLTSITIPSLVTSIGSYSFYNCSSLAYITTPESVTSIGGYCFYNVPRTCIMNITNGWNKFLATYAGFEGTFNIV
ncbi:MAG: leucine-rich repeat domain-containing protein, partial [Ureaplasma sp.]|nr:leucine-rich repeat domain-containing protein [Ureaplasma sp.]